MDSDVARGEILERSSCLAFAENVANPLYSTGRLVDEVAKGVRDRFSSHIRALMDVVCSLSCKLLFVE